MTDSKPETAQIQQDDDQHENKQINGATDTGKEDRKLFVGGLSSETTHDQLKEYFIKFGDIVNIDIKIDPHTGRSRGFAFILFSKADAIDKVLSAGDHIINNKKVDPKKAKIRIGKIFVGGLVPQLTDDDIKNYFAQYGNIVEVETPFDKVKKQRKGFCFISFESEQVANEVLKRPKQTINGKQVDVKRLTVKPNAYVGIQGGGRGRGRGGWGAGPGRQRGYSGYDPYGGYDVPEWNAFGRFDYYDSGYDYPSYSYSSSAYNRYGGPPSGGYRGGKQMGRGRGGSRQQPY